MGKKFLGAKGGCQGDEECQGDECQGDGVLDTLPVLAGAKGTGFLTHECQGDGVLGTLPVLG